MHRHLFGAPQDESDVSENSGMGSVATCKYREKRYRISRYNRSTIRQNPDSAETICP